MLRVLDTNHLTELERDSLAGRHLRSKLHSQSDELATTIVTVEEHLRGWLALIRRFTDPHQQIPAYERLQHQVDFFASWLVLPFDREAADLFKHFQKERVRISSMDLKIACVAIAHDAILLTRNTVDFSQVPGLRFENWLD